MLRLLVIAGLLALTLRAAETAVMVRDIPAPATDNAGSSTVTMSPDGLAWLTWLETSGGASTLRCATFDATAQRWSAAHTIATGTNLYRGASDVPAITAGRDGTATALWYVNNPESPATAHLHHGAGYHAVTSSTRDRGRTWSPPAPLSRESELVEFTALATLADGRVLAVWLDGRAKKAAGPHAHAHGGGATQQLFSRVVGSAGADTLVDAAVCDCCHTALTAFPDGTALLAYRGRGEGEVRDIRVARFRGAGWDDARWLSRDDWRIAGCPVNGPQLASDGGRVAAAWFTAADNDPRVLASFSPDAGGRFLMPLRLSGEKPAGRVSTVLLHDGALLVSWVDAAGFLALRRVTPDYGLGPVEFITRPEHGRIKGFPRLALLRDYQGDKTSAQLLVTYTTETAPTLHTALVTVPEGALLELGKDCDCAPTPEQLQGYPLRGVIDGLSDQGTIRVKHSEVPGMFAAGTREFLIDRAALTSAVQPGRQFLARFERAGGQWRLFDLRLIATPQD